MKFCPFTYQHDSSGECQVRNDGPPDGPTDLLFPKLIITDAGEFSGTVVMTVTNSYGIGAELSFFVAAIDPPDTTH